MRSSILLSILVVAAFSCVQGAEEWDQPWDDLRTTFVPGLDATVDGDLGGLRLPLMTEPTGDCANIIGENVFYGHRVPQPFGNDTYTSVYTLYDVNGYISGIQVLFPFREVMTPGNNFRYEDVPMFRNATIDGEQYFILTAYFVDPDTICTTGRSAPSPGRPLETGDRLLFQTGQWPSTHLLAPKNRTEAIDYGYSENRCLVGMGNHTFYGVMPDSDCDTLVPVFLLQNKAGYMTGFGFDFIGLASSGRFEHPPSYVIDIIVGPTRPQCLLDTIDTIGATTCHIYFTATNPECDA